MPPSVAPAPVTLTVKPPTPDEVFIAEISRDGINDSGLETARHAFMEAAQYVCYALLPPRPQQFEAVVANVVANENKNVQLGASLPAFAYADGEHLVHAAITAYCPAANPTH